MARLSPALLHPRDTSRSYHDCGACGALFHARRRAKCGAIALPVTVRGDDSGAEDYSAYLWPDGWTSGGDCEYALCLQCSPILAGYRYVLPDDAEGRGACPCDTRTAEPGDGPADYTLGAL